MRDDVVVLASKDVRTAEQYAGNKGSVWILKADKGTKLANADNAQLKDDIWKKLNDDNDRPIELDEYLAYADREKFDDDINPRRIADTAGIWDEWRFVEWFAENYDYDGIITNDGIAIVRPDKFIKTKVSTTKPPAEQVLPTKTDLRGRPLRGKKVALVREEQRGYGEKQGLSEDERASGRTAIARTTVSRPTAWLVDKSNKLFGLSKNSKILHYGSGRASQDTKKLQSAGNVDEYDVNYAPDKSVVGNADYDVVVSNYVLNVLPPALRKKAIREIGQSLNKSGKAFIAVRGHGDTIRGKAEYDGLRTSTGSFQKTFSRQDIVDALKPFFKNVSVIKGTDKSGTVIVEVSGYNEKTSSRVPGKKMADNIYVHKDYASAAGVPDAILDKAKNNLPDDYAYTAVKYNTKDDSVSFIQSPDFDTADEPTVGKSIKVLKDGTTSVTNQPSDPLIWHHKWQFVGDDYNGFDVEASKRRSQQWRSVVGVNKEVSSRIGRKSYWEREVVPKLSPPSPQASVSGDKSVDASQSILDAQKSIAEAGKDKPEGGVREAIRPYCVKDTKGRLKRTAKENKKSLTGPQIMEALFNVKDPALKAEDVTENTFSEIDKVKTSDAEVKWWENTYKNATLVEGKKGSGKKELMRIGGPGKIEGIAVINLTRNCQRLNWIQRAIDLHLLPADTPLLDCYESCWTNRKMGSSQNVRVSGFVPQQERPIAFTNKEQIDRYFKSKSSITDLKNTKEIRHGQDGDDSHAIYMGLAEYWLQKCKEHGINTPNVFISASYAPTSLEHYKKLAPYKDMFVIHFTNSGWFPKGEILNRFGEYLKAKKAGLNAGIRFVTNKNNVSAALKKDDIKTKGPLTMPNEQFLVELIEKHIPKKEWRSSMLETPYHNDALKAVKDYNERSDPQFPEFSECCATGFCSTFGPSCLTRFLVEGKLKDDFLVSDSIANYNAVDNQLIESGKTAIDDQKRFEAEEQDIAYGSTEKADKVIEEAIKQLETFSAKVSNRTLSDSIRPHRSKVIQALKNLKHIRYDGFKLDKANIRQQLAELFQVYRNPNMEILHVIYRNNKGEILTHHAITSGNASGIYYKTEDLLREIRLRMNNLGAKKVDLIHNHPTADVRMSQADSTFAWKIKNHSVLGLGKILGEFIIINHEQYSFAKVRKNGVKSTIQKYQLSENPTGWNPITSLKILTPEGAARFGRTLHLNNNQVAFVYLDSVGQIRGWTSHDVAFLKVSPKEFEQVIRRNMKAHGTELVVMITEDKLENIGHFKNVTKKYFDDFIYGKEFSSYRETHGNEYFVSIAILVWHLKEVRNW